MRRMRARRVAKRLERAADRLIPNIVRAHRDTLRAAIDSAKTITAAFMNYQYMHEQPEHIQIAARRADPRLFSFATQMRQHLENAGMRGRNFYEGWQKGGPEDIGDDLISIIWNDSYEGEVIAHAIKVGLMQPIVPNIIRHIKPVWIMYNERALRNLWR